MGRFDRRRSASGYKQSCLFPGHLRRVRPGFRGHPQHGDDRTRTMGKTFLLLAILTATALWSCYTMGAGQLELGVISVAGIAGFILALVTIFKPTAAPWTSPVYAAMEGVFRGHLPDRGDAVPQVYPGIALQAVMLTRARSWSCCFLYGNGIIKVTDRLKAGIMAATGALCLFYMVSMVLRLFGVTVPLILRARLSGSALASSWSAGGVQPAARLRLHRAIRAPADAQVHGVVWGVRPDGHSGLALPRDAPPALEDRRQPRLTGAAAIQGLAIVSTHEGRQTDECLPASIVLGPTKA